MIHITCDFCQVTIENSQKISEQGGILKYYEEAPLTMNSTGEVKPQIQEVTQALCSNCLKKALKDIKK